MLMSKVPRFEGLCKPTWINRNMVCIRLDGGITGFFKLVKKKYGFYWRTGKEFHGIIDYKGYVHSTKLEDIYGY